MIFQIESKERELFEVVASCAKRMGVPAYLVGGYVRDRVLGRESKDVDVVCVGDGIALAEAVAQQLFPSPKVVVYGRFGTAMFRHHDFIMEFVGARKESYSLDSRKPEVKSGSLEDDQRRRDFTINAMAISLDESDFGTLIDPFGGLVHLEQRIIKTPLDPNQTFSDDPLRMMRAVRFSTQLEFNIEKGTYDALKFNKSRIHIISKERITTELEKIISSPVPSIGLKQLFDTGILALIFPEMAELQGIEIRDGKAHKDNFYHTLEVLDNLSRMTDNIWLRWSAILHDIAKPPTKRFDPIVGWTFHGHEVLGAAMVPRIFGKLRLPLDSKMKYVQKLVRLHLRPISLTKEEITDSAIRRLIVEAGEDLDDLMMLAKADVTSKNREKVVRIRENYELVRLKIQEVEERDRLRNWQPPIDGELIMKTFNLKPGGEVGKIKIAVREAILDGEIPNDYESAFNFMIKEGKRLGLI
jgi:poly(A) polymerase